MSVQEHKQKAPSVVHCKVVTISDTRDKDTDKSGKLMIQYLQKNGHKVVDYIIVPDEKEAIHDAVITGCKDHSIEVVLLNGGTGIAKRDITIETLQPLLDKEIVGFGEIFRMLSYQEDIGSAAIMSRALAGVIEDTAVISTPGSSGAVKLAMEKLVLPEIAHIVREIIKDRE